MEEYDGSLGTSVAQVFDLTAAATGINEKTLKGMGLAKGRDYEVALINQKSHAGYYPMAIPMTLKLIFGLDGKIFGAQIVGQDGVDKRIDTIATVMRVGGTVKDLAKLELAYAPPYSSAKDPVNMAGFVADNILKGLVRFVMPEEISDKMVVLDVSEDVERSVWQMPGSIHIPLGQLRDRMEELPKGKTIVTYCAIGVRSYNGARMLMQSGFDDVRVLAGGAGFYKTYYSKPEQKEFDKEFDQAEAEVREVSEKEIKILDCCGLQCPGPIMKVNEALNAMEEGGMHQSFRH